MCINKRWITNPVTGVKVFVSCGRCEACQQEKANKRTLRINLQTKLDVPIGYQTILLTLTYNNDYVPFILRKDYENFIDGKSNFLPVYRYGFKSYTGNVKRPLRYLVLLDSFENKCYDVDNTQLKLKGNFVTDWLSECPDTSLPALRSTHWYNGKKYYSYDDCRIGVLYYKDIQNFLKRLRITLKRKYNANFKLKFFCVGEYGPDSFRPHYHLLLHFPKGYFTQLENAIIESWKFDSISKYQFRCQQIKLAKDAASYVSAYVNKSSNFPDFFKAFRPFRQKHVYSLGYGMESKYCQLSYLDKCVNSAEFYYQKIIKVGSVKSVIKLPLPAYVINRYYPKFKGFSRLTDYEILLNISNPDRFFEYKKTIGYTDDDLHKIVVSLRNHYLKWCNLKKLPVNDYSLADYSRSYVNSWKSYYSFLHKLGYNDVLTEQDLVYHFINWYEFRNKDGDLAEKLGFLTSYYGNFEKDPNKFPLNIANHNKLITTFNHNLKKKKVKNNVLSSFSYV